MWIAGKSATTRARVEKAILCSIPEGPKGIP